VPASVWSFEACSPKTPLRKKMHYVPATPSTSHYSPQAASQKQVSPMSFKNELPTPPPSHASSSPKQYPSSPPKRHYTPAPALALELPAVDLPITIVQPPTPSPSETSSRPEVATSKLARFALAGRETSADDAAIEELMQSFDRYMDSLIDKSDCGSEISID